jgi:carotenoid 1,2-hydratase
MTERGRAQVRREAREFTIGPSRLHWTGDALVIDVCERAVPIPHAVRGRITLHPQGLSTHVAALDPQARHRWGPIAASARIEVALERPGARWSGQAYFDANDGDEPIDRPFDTWDWSRAALRDGSTAVLYDVRHAGGGGTVLARRFHPGGQSEPFEAPSRQALPATRLWRIARGMRSEAGEPARVLQTLEDTPFYSRSLLQAGLCGERVTAVHESLSLPRLVAPSTQWMLPWRMPRRA